MKKEIIKVPIPKARISLPDIMAKSGPFIDKKKQSRKTKCRKKIKQGE